MLAANPGPFEEILAEFATIDWGAYARPALALQDHSAAAYLPHSRCRRW